MLKDNPLLKTKDGRDLKPLVPKEYEKVFLRVMREQALLYPLAQRTVKDVGQERKDA